MFVRDQFVLPSVCLSVCKPRPRFLHRAVISELQSETRSLLAAVLVFARITGEYRINYFRLHAELYVLRRISFASAINGTAMIYLF
jgi:hypothetical protein